MIRRIAKTAALLGAAVFCSGFARAEPPELTIPVDCALGETCFIQHYVDRDPRPGIADYACGTASYDGHSGTDFRVADHRALHPGIAVLAAAPGRVEATRSTVPDTGRGEMPDGQDCGNGVRISHGDGWETQYCHLRQGSIEVAPGDEVEAGTPLGLIGYSGNTEFPHLHMTLRHEGVVIDPFHTGANSCNAHQSLWQDIPAYQPGGILSVGFATAVPEYADIQQGNAHIDRMARTGPALVLWGFAYLGRPGDQMRLHITSRDGRTVHDQLAEIDRAQAQFFRAAGRRIPATGWPSGLYTGEVSLIREGRVIDRTTTEITLE